MRLSKINQIYLCFIVCVMPLVFWSGSSDRTGQIKWYFWGAAAGLYSILALKDLINERQLFKMNPLTLPLSGFLLLAFLSSFWAVNFSFALKSCLVFFLYWQFFLVSSSTELNWLIFSNCLEFAALIVSLYGIIQTLGPLFRGEALYYPVSTLGNPNFTAEFLLPVFLLTLGKLLGGHAQKERGGTALCKNSWQKSYDLLCGLHILGALFLSRSSAALIALGISLSFLLLIWSNSFERPWPAIQKLTAWLVVLGLGLIIFFTSPGRAMLSNFSTKSHNTRFRYYTYASTTKMFLGNFWRGVGFNNFEFVFPLYRQQAEIDLTDDPEVVTDKAHNEYLQFAAETGVAGVIAEICLLCLLAGLLSKAAREGASASGTRLWGVAAAIIAMLAQAFLGFNLHNAATGALFFFLLGQIAQETEKSLAGKANPFSSLNDIGKTLLLIMGVGLAIVGLIFTGREFFADYYLKKGLALEEAIKDSGLKTTLAATKEYQLAYRLNPTSLEITYHQARSLTEQGKTNEGIALYQNLLRRAPYYLPALNNLGISLGILKQWTAAEQAFLQIIALDKTNLNALTNLANLYQINNRPPEAIDMLRQILRKNPRHKISNYNLGALLEEVNDLPESLAVWENYLKLIAEPKERAKVEAHINQLKLRLEKK